MVSKDIVHRDLKPQNILMNHEGRSLKNPQPQDIKLKIGNAKKLENLFSWVGLKIICKEISIYLFTILFSGFRIC